MSAFSRSLILMALQIAAISGCGSDSSDKPAETTKPGGENPTASTDDDTLRVVFSPMYSAFVPGHEATLPVVVDGKTGAEVEFTAEDPTLVDIKKTEEGAMLTMLKAGSTKIHAKAGAETGTAKLTVTAFTADEWEIGAMRYNNGNALGLADAGIPMAPPAGGMFMLNLPPDTACAACHSETSEVGDFLGSDIEHTPRQAGGYSDAELLNVVTLAKKPSGVGMHTMIPSGIWEMFHKWNVEEPQKRGVLAYIRTLTPKKQGALGFPMFRRDGGVPAAPTAP